MGENVGAMVAIETSVAVAGETIVGEAGATTAAADLVAGSACAATGEQPARPQLSRQPRVVSQKDMLWKLAGK